MSWVLNRLKEPSTWKGIVVLLSLVGVRFSPEATDLIVELGVTAIGLILVIQKERAIPDEPKKVEIVLPPVDLVARPESPPVFVPDDSVQAGRPSEADPQPGNGSGWNG